METNKLYVPVIFNGRKTEACVTIYGTERSKKQILCLHGIGSSGQKSFRYLAEHLSSDYHMLAVDWLGFGDSSRLLGKEDTYDAEYCSMWFQAFINSAIDQRVLRPYFNVIATSMSAIPLAISYKTIETHLDSIILINPAGLDTRINKTFAFVLTNPWLNHQALARLLLRKFIWGKILGWNDYYWHRLNKGLTNGELELFLRYAKAGILPSGRMKPTHIVPDKFAEIGKPVLLIYSRDNIFYEQQYLRFARLRKNWKTIYIDWDGHTPAVQQPKLVADEIRKFLSNS